MVGFRYPIKVLCIELLNGEFQPATTGQPPLLVILGADTVVREINLGPVEFARQQARYQLFLPAAPRDAPHLRAIGAKSDQ